MTLDLDPRKAPTIRDIRRKTQTYHVVFEMQVPGHEYLMVELGDMPNPDARYRVIVEVEQLPVESDVFGVPQPREPLADSEGWA